LETSVQVNIFKTKTNLSRLVEAVESGEEAEIVIARNGKPAARLVPIAPKKTGQRIGVGKGKFTVADPLPLHHGDPLDRLLIAQGASGAAEIGHARQGRSAIQRRDHLSLIDVQL
jgi:prevent-host-death family protein